MKPTYFGPSVRIVYRGSEPDYDLTVQRFSDTSGDWHDVRTFDHSFDFAWSDSRLYASTLSAHMRREVTA
jgi:hypothetical protein